MIDWTKPIQAVRPAGALRAELVYTNINNPFPRLVVLHYLDGSDGSYWFTEIGYTSGERWNIQNVPEKIILDGWMVMIEHGNGLFYTSEVQAHCVAASFSPEPQDVVHVHCEVEP